MNAHFNLYNLQGDLLPTENIINRGFMDAHFSIYWQELNLLYRLVLEKSMSLVTHILVTHLLYNVSFTQNNLLPTVRSDCKKLGAAPISSNSLKPVRSDSREQIYFKIIWCE